MGGWLTMGYGLACYALFLATFLYAIAFVGDLPVPTSVDRGVAAPPAEAVVVNLLLLGLFAAQHSVMARRGFKRWWTRIVPPAAERSTFVLAASLALALLFWQWRPIPQIVWQTSDVLVTTLLHTVFWLGWALLLVSTFLIDHLELFGLRQAFTRFTGRPLRAPDFRTPLFYRHVRHPIYLGFILAFWAAPTMTVGHLLFAAGGTGYILLGIWFEERDLVHQFGDRYRRYRDQVGMLLPRLTRANHKNRATP